MVSLWASPAIKITHISIGQGGLESEAWVRAAGLFDLDTFYVDCHFVLTSKEFLWPDGVTNVSYGFGNPIEKPR